MNPMMKATLALTCVLASCGGTGGGANEPATGIYRVVVKTNADTCQPARLSGNAGQIDVAVGTRAISIGVPLQSGQAWERFELDTQNGYATQHDEPTSCGDAHRHLELQKTASSTDGLDVSWIEDWTVSQPCTGPNTVPTTSCRSDRVLSYSLIMACKLPLVIYGGVDGNLSCQQ